LTKPWLYMPPGLAHSFGPFALRCLSVFKARPAFVNKPTKKLGLNFETPFGTAGGLDKSAKDLGTWNKWGAGFIEVGTFTPKPQGPNPGKIIDRDKTTKALWNCMGFPNSGFEAVKPRIQAFKEKHSTPVFINIGKNRDTPLENAADDYVAGVKFFAGLADCFVVNISSPNTKDLRLLHSKENFRKFIGPVLEASLSLPKKTPLLVKLSPDLDDASFSQFISDASDLPIDGFVLTNTTQSRPLGSKFPERGGLSGGPVKDLAISKLKLARKCLGSDSNKCLISVGGVMDADDAVERLNLGADLVQAYSGLIFYGPGLFIDSAKKLQS